MKLFCETSSLLHFPSGIPLYAASLLAQLATCANVELHTGMKMLRAHLHWRLRRQLAKIPQLHYTYHARYLPGRLARWGKFRAAHYDVVHFLASVAPAYVAFDNLHNAVLTVHDVFQFEPLTNAATARIYYDRYILENLPRQAASARRLITVSEFSKKKMVHYLNVAPEKIAVIPLAAQTLPPPAPREKLTELGLAAGKFFLAVGVLMPNKNYPTLLAAFAKYQARARGEKLVIVGKRFPHDEKLFAQISAAANVHYLPNVAPATLALLYANARGFFAPATIEGFGLPLLEAMTAQTPAAYATGSSMDEIGRDAALRFAPMDVDAIAEIFQHFADGGAVITNNVERAQVIANEYRWEKTAAATRELYAQIAGKN